MNLLAPISTIMQTNLITLNKDDTIEEAEKIFQENRIHHILIVDRLKLVGVLSKSDFLFFQRGIIQAENEKIQQRTRNQLTTVETIMTKGIATLEPTDRINVALEIFKENLFHAIPIVGENRLLGIVTTYDILARLSTDKEVTSSYEI